MKAKVKLPFTGTNRHHFNDHHETTLGFGDMLPVFSKYLAPNEKLSVSTAFFGRSFPMVVPTFGDVRVNFHGFFVPFSSVWDHFDDFIDGLPSPVLSSFNTFTRFKTPVLCTQSNLVRMFMDERHSVPVTDGNDFDFEISSNFNDGDQTLPTKFRFTLLGKRAYHILQALGLNFSFTRFERGEQEYDILPVLCFVWVWYENFIPERYKQYNYLRNIRELLHDRMPNSNGAVYLSLDELKELFIYLRLSYSEDYFTSLWQNPNQTNANIAALNLSSQISYPYDQNASTEEYSVVDEVGGQQAGNNNQINQNHNTEESSRITGEIAVRRSTNNTISPWAITLAQRIQGWFTRHSLAGSDKLNNILSEYGIKPIETMGVPHYLGSATIQLKIDSVFDTAGSVQELGSYAGKAHFSGQLPKFSFHAKEHGMFFVIASVESRSHFTQGIDRIFLYHDMFDFFKTTFDGVNMQATPVAELFNAYIDGDKGQMFVDSTGAQPYAILGYAPRYAERKFPRFRVTGDFNVRTLGQSIEGFTLQRNFLVRSADWSSAPKLASGRDRLKFTDIVYQNDAAQYNRVFKDTTGRTDAFLCLFDFDYSLQSPMLPYKESFNQYSSGKEITMDSDGDNMQ